MMRAAQEARRRQRRIQRRRHEEHVAEPRVGHDPKLNACTGVGVHNIMAPRRTGAP